MGRTTGHAWLIPLALAAWGCTAPAARTGTEAATSTDMRDGLTGRRWKLVELNGQALSGLEREPYLVLEPGGRFSGFGGCNTLTGSYRLEAAVSRIRFERTATTMKECLAGMDVERAFAEVLAKADNYSLGGNHLTLNRARMAPLARFEPAD